MKPTPDLRKAMLQRATAASRPGTAKTTSTQPRVNVAGYFPPEVKWQLRVLAAEQKTTVQYLMAKGLNYVFAEYGKPEIAPLD